MTCLDALCVLSIVEWCGAGFFELNNGCICCSVKEDLLTTLEQLVLHKDRFDYVLIETTGWSGVSCYDMI